MNLIVFLDERNIYPAYKISFLNSKTANPSDVRHPITKNGSFRGRHLGLCQYELPHVNSDDPIGFLCQFNIHAGLKTAF